MLYTFGWSYIYKNTAGQTELTDECDYVREAEFLRRFGSPEYLGNDVRFKVPWVWDGSTKTVLVMERVDGVSVGEANALRISERDRVDVCRSSF